MGVANSAGTAALSGLAYESAARHMTLNIPVVNPSATVAEARERVMGRRFDSLTDIAVCEGDRLLGLVRIEDLMCAPPEAPVTGIMDADPPVVAPGVDQEVAAWKAVQHGEGALAVVDDSQRFRGLIPPQRLLAVLLAEHDEDMARLGGFLKGTSEARTASEEPVARRLWHRLPWLFVGLAGALVAAVIVDAFEQRLRSEVTLAFFLPGIVYLADAVGTQTETIVIRGLSVGVGIRSIRWREIATGVFAGLALAAIFYPVAAIVWEADVALAVALALMVACSAASVIALVLPSIFSALRLDPAFGSGPLATVIQDLLSIVVYLGIAELLLG